MVPDEPERLRDMRKGWLRVVETIQEAERKEASDWTTFLLRRDLALIEQNRGAYLAERADLIRTHIRQAYHFVIGQGSAWLLVELGFRAGYAWGFWLVLCLSTELPIFERMERWAILRSWRAMGSGLSGA